MADQTNHRALLLTNLGSPKSTQVKDVKEYLTEFLMDKRVMDFPYLLRLLLVKGLVVPKRAPSSAKAYEKVWRPEGSPLIIYANRLKEAVQKKASFSVALSMRYGEPTTDQAFQELLRKNPDIKEVLVLPLYPQYTMSSFRTAVEKIKKDYRRQHYPFKIQFFDPFYNQEDYIADLAKSIQPFLEADYDKILFSYHGLPERHLKKDEAFMARGTADYRLPKINYQEQARETTRLAAEYLHIPEGKYETSFQSRLVAAGREWLKPYTSIRLKELPKEGVKKLLVVCPAFINDCLETIEEIGMDGKSDFEEAGGESLTLIPCLNDDPHFADTIIKWVENGQ